MPRAGDSNQRRSRISNPGTRAPHEPPSAPPQANQPKQRRLTWTLHAATLVGGRSCRCSGAYWFWTAPSAASRPRPPPHQLADLPRVEMEARHCWLGIARVWRRPNTSDLLGDVGADGLAPRPALNISWTMGRKKSIFIFFDYGRSLDRMEHVVSNLMLYESLTMVVV